MLRRAYDWCIAAADKPYAMWLMGGISFAESSFFPIPPDTMLIPMSLAHPKRAFTFATWCTVMSSLPVIQESPRARGTGHEVFRFLVVFSRAAG